MNWRNRPTVTRYLSKRKLLTVAGAASPIGPPSAATATPTVVPPSLRRCGSYVRSNVLPVTSKLVQQLSVPLPPGPQLVMPGPPGAQLGGDAGLAPASPPIGPASVAIKPFEHSRSTWHCPPRQHGASTRSRGQLH